MVKPEEAFHADHYIRHNARRLEHLASLGLPLHDKTVLEVGAGIGDHTTFYLDRGCRVTTSDGRAQNLAHLQYRFHGNPDVKCVWLDMNDPPTRADAPDQVEAHQIIHCYGLLYHLQQPARAIAWMSEHCTEMLLLETCVSLGDDMRLPLVGEAESDPSQALSGTGCRPTRVWVFEELKKHFPHVYVPRTQPNHPEFPIDWSGAKHYPYAELTRAVFIATKHTLHFHSGFSQLYQDIPMYQQRAG